MPETNRPEGRMGRGQPHRRTYNNPPTATSTGQRKQAGPTACFGGCGTAFKITPSGTLTTPHTFGGVDGAYSSR